MSGPTGLRRFVPATAPRPDQAPPNQTAPDQATPDQAPAVMSTAQLLPGAPEVVLEKIRATAAARPDESCEMCTAEILPSHSHVADLEKSSLLCVCRPCYLLFESRQAGGGRYRRVPDRYVFDATRPMSVAEWDELEIPVGLAFFMYSSQAGEMAGFYPSPAGSTECRLDLSAWERMAQAHPLLAAIEPDVEAVLITRSDKSSIVEHFIVPIDACYELAGRMRMLWKGFDGGTEARQSIAEFLDEVRAQAKAFTPEPS
ncbi:MAG TPA: DUF5947 family protein [Streptosporangiaceae bacterium]|jgi:hypothetical protein